MILNGVHCKCDWTNNGAKQGFSQHSAEVSTYSQVCYVLTCLWLQCSLQRCAGKILVSHQHRSNHIYSVIND